MSKIGAIQSSNQRAFYCVKEYIWRLWASSCDSWWFGISNFLQHDELSRPSNVLGLPSFEIPNTKIDSKKWPIEESQKHNAAKQDFGSYLYYFSMDVKQKRLYCFYFNVKNSLFQPKEVLRG